MDNLALSLPYGAYNVKLSNSIMASEIPATDINKPTEPFGIVASE
jgi:hypothetical protein